MITGSINFNSFKALRNTRLYDALDMLGVADNIVCGNVTVYCDPEDPMDDFIMTTFEHEGKTWDLSVFPVRDYYEVHTFLLDENGYETRVGNDSFWTPSCWSVVAAVWDSVHDALERAKAKGE